ncbi:3-phosphoshikimate 1-carboxyvinyltransferase [Ruminococcaceae bacterium OttesenSCG-928-A16]|nr:3-phosphoshikimate 1-carboxyvinyltransferase [Ruminococcaceae bacterium OttesenSCG-928-A16]
MDAIILPSKLGGTLQVPPSKSMAHRLLICAALARGTSQVQNLSYSVDITATATAMAQLGAQLNTSAGTATVTGTGGHFAPPTKAVNCHESGSTLRLLIPVFSLLGKPVKFTGAARLFQRPHAVYANIFKNQNLPFTQTETSLEIQGPLQSGHYSLAGNVSSQFISGLLFALPLLQGNSTLTIAPPFESRSYVLLTQQAQSLFGVQSNWLNKNTLHIPGGQQYNATHCTVEGDWSQAAVPAVLGAVLGGVSVAGLSQTSAQGDKAILDILQRCGAAAQWQNGLLTLTPPPGGLCTPSDIDMADCPDLGPIVSTLGLFCRGTTRLVNAGRLRIKESDRIAAMQTELNKLGGALTSTQSTLTIPGPAKLTATQPAAAHTDHRIVMALTAAALMAGMPLTIAGAEAITKSWPSFFKDLQTIGAKVELT